MLKIVIFDSGYGGELLADYIEDTLPIVDIIRVIDWRHATEIQQSARLARKFAEQSLKPYLGKVDLIIFANYLLSITGLKYFCHRYKQQKFLGLQLNHPNNFRQNTYIFTTKSVAKTFAYQHFARKIKAKTLSLDDWPILIDDGELGHAKIRRDLTPAIAAKSTQIILACSQFVDLADELRKLFGHNLKLIDNFDEVARQACQVLKIRGSLKKQK